MLLQPLRAKIDRIAAETRELLESSFADAAERSMGYDSAMDALEQWERGEFTALGLVARDVKSEVNAAIEGREGFDTWDAPAREEFIAKAGKLAARFWDLSRAVAELQRHECAEIEELRKAVAA